MNKPEISNLIATLAYALFILVLAGFFIAKTGFLSTL